MLGIGRWNGNGLMICPGGLYGLFIYMASTKVNYLINLNVFIYYKLAWFIIIMFIVNRGAIITQAMFFNCDHAMLNYNFYREEKTILNLLNVFM